MSNERCTVLIASNFYRDIASVQRLARRAKQMPSARDYATAAHVSHFELLLGSPLAYDPTRWTFGGFETINADDWRPFRLERPSWYVVVCIQARHSIGVEIMQPSDTNTKLESSPAATGSWWASKAAFDLSEGERRPTARIDLQENELMALPADQLPFRLVGDGGTYQHFFAFRQPDMNNAALHGSPTRSSSFSDHSLS